MLTHRLQLIPATVALCEAELRGPAAVSSLLQATMPEEWPPPVFEPDDIARVQRQLTAAPPSASHWTLYYILLPPLSDAERPALIGIAGYVGPPTFDGVIEIGYALLPSINATDMPRRPLLPSWHARSLIQGCGLL